MTHATTQPHSFRLTHGAYAAEILQTGATLAVLTHAGRDLILPVGDPRAPAFPGALLAPWPNRTVDGRYAFDGTVRELPINEPERHHALHGFAHALTFTQTSSPQAAALELTATLEPTPAYPWQLRFTAHFSLDDDGLHYGLSTENLSTESAPFGASIHPYLVAGPGPIDAWDFELPVSERLEVTPDRLIPRYLAPAGSFVGRLGDAQLDHAFTGISWAGDRATARLRAPDGSGVEMSWDRTCPWVQVFTCDVEPDALGFRSAVAVEPMTCAPDALNDAVYPYDTGLVTVAPGETFSTAWRIGAIEI